jgi:hypothetical protein
VPKIVTKRAIPSQYVVLELKLVPGGKYLVASVRDVCNYWYFLVVYCMDHPSGPIALARLETDVKAFNIEAQYMTYDHKQVLMIAYTRRYYPSGTPEFPRGQSRGPFPDTVFNPDDPSKFSSRHPIDFPYPIRREVCCVYLDLNVLDTLSNPFLKPHTEEWKAVAISQGDPFNYIQIYNSAHEVEPDSLSLFEVDGDPHLTLIQLPNTIIFANLTPNRISLLRPSDPPGFEGRVCRFLSFLMVLY